ncbi:MAG: aminopeptidase N [Nannocystaceae bacterium]|nr:aminopeptidase N [Nannocystaceae bacterium]
MKDPQPQPIYRKDYQPTAYLVDTVDLSFELGEDESVVTATLGIRRAPGAKPGTPLVLDGERLELRSIAIDGAPLAADRYRVESATLTVLDVPEAFSLETVVALRPQDNTELAGLYRSGQTFCTQCEAEGFRRITYFLDRPDVMARYTTRIEADKRRYPVLLSNGNRVDAGEAEGGRHWVRWQDPFPKPSYLFALVAADLRCHDGSFTTASGRDVKLEIWVEPHNIDACEHALRSLGKAMAWDERVFGREYDLDLYMIVAVSDFNMAAMENKGLNIFNDKFVLARPQTATDDDYENIEGVIGHEYFHNWTGNRITCRDWFQLTLKEGLTVFRDEQFTADMTSAAVKRITDVSTLRTAQFAEDRGPNRHPIRPDAYVEMNNFYTVTVYNKGAEVIRMLHTLLGATRFRKGMDTYFERHDGQAVTCDDFLAAIADGGDIDLRQFSRWYEQAGTPTLSVEGQLDADASTYTVTLCQQAPAELPQWQAMHMPVAIGLVGEDGNDIALHPRAGAGAVTVRGTTAVCEMTELQHTIVFDKVTGPVVPSLLRDFSAPVRLQTPHSPDDLAFLMGNDSDAFRRWDAAQIFARTILLDNVANAADGALPVDARFVDAWGRIVTDKRLDGSLKALIMTLPDERLLGQSMTVVDPDGLHAVREAAASQLADAHATDLAKLWRALAPSGPYSVETQDIARRRLRNTILRYLCAQSDDAARTEALSLAHEQLTNGDNMTDVQSAFVRLVEAGGSHRDQAIEQFYAKWHHDPLVLDKWFSVQAMSSCSDTLQRVIALCEHQDFTLDNPNRTRALLGVFAVRNQVRFHDASGKGYALLADKILALDPRNPQVAARLVSAFNHWRRFDEARGAAMQAALRRIVATEGLSADVAELATKALG